MKKILIGLLVVIVLVGGGVYYVFSNLDEMVRVAIEQAGTEAMGSQVKVGSVELKLLEGRASIYDFSIANPEGFSNADMISFDELSVILDVNNISGEAIGIASIVARNPTVFFESNSSSSNFEVMSERFEGSEEPVAEEASGVPGPVLTIASILIEDIQASLQSDLLTEVVEVNLGDIVLENLQGTPEEIASQVMGPVISQLSATAADALLTAVIGMDMDDLEELAEERIEEELENLEAEATAELDEALGEELSEGLRSLLR